MADPDDKTPFADDDTDANTIAHYSALSVNPDIANDKSTSPSGPSTSGSLVASSRFRVVLCILFSEFFERLTYYSISGNLVLFCTSQLNFTSDTAAVIALVFGGSAFFSPVFGGWFADSISGKYNTIYGALLIYIIGAMLLPIISIDYGEIEETLGFTYGAKQAYFFIALIAIVIGTGGVKANVGPFGAQQLDDAGEKAVQTFFNWFYWFVKMGTVFSFSLVVFVQQDYGFAWGYAICALSSFISVILFLMGKTSYTMLPPGDSPMTTVTKVVVAGASQCRHTDDRDEGPDEIESCIDRVKESHGGKFPDQTVEDVKTIGRIIPVFASIIFYWTLNFQTQSTFLLQAERMNVGISGFKLPVASLNLFTSVCIVLLIPITDTIIFPFFDRIGMPLRPLHRIGIGMVLVSLGAAVAGIVEMSRKNTMHEPGGWKVQTLAGESFNASTMSVFVLVPQFALIGASEVFTSIAGLEFAYSQSPAYLQGVLMGFWLASVGLGNFVGLLYVTIVNAITKSLGAIWFPDEINDGYMEYYFFLIAGINLLDFAIFLLIAKWYKYVKQPLSSKEAVNDIDNDNARTDGNDTKDPTGQTYGEDPT